MVFVADWIDYKEFIAFLGVSLVVVDVIIFNLKAWALSWDDKTLICFDFSGSLLQF